MDAILQTVVGGLLALGGVLIGPYFQRKHERWKAKREDQNILRAKAQELFDELDSIIRQSQEASLAAVARMQDAAVKAKPVPDLGRVRAIAAIYFPTSLPLIENFETQHQQVTEFIVGEAKKAVDAGGQELETLKGLPMVMTVKYQQFASKFVREMREHLATNVPKIDLEDKQ